MTLLNLTRVMISLHHCMQIPVVFSIPSDIDVKGQEKAILQGADVCLSTGEANELHDAN
jgi:hypothetical protein